MIIVRRYQDEDFLVINKILNDNFSIEKRNSNSDSDHIELVALFDNKVVGYLLITKVIDFITCGLFCHIDYVCVDKNYRSLGIGRKLVSDAINICKDIGAGYIELSSSRFRKEARSLYHDLGFVIRDSDIFRKELL